jgi:hypothetical protein
VFTGDSPIEIPVSSFHHAHFFSKKVSDDLIIALYTMRLDSMYTKIVSTVICD